MRRSSHHSRLQRSIERIERVFYAQGWAARMAFAMRLQGGVRAKAHRLAIPATGGCGVRAPLRLAFASDFHAGPLTDPRLFAQAFAAIAAFEPDAVLLGGDYVSLHEMHLPTLTAEMARLRPPLGIFAVLGNHDLYVDDVALCAQLEAAGVQVLVNRSIRLPPPHDDLAICGLDEPRTGRPDPDLMMRDAATHRILLMHSPIGLAAMGDHAFDLVFCGHTHGGQIALPGGVPVFLPPGSGPRAHAHGEMALPMSGATMIVSRGIGMSEIPVRLNAPSEVHLCVVERIP